MNAKDHAQDKRLTKVIRENISLQFKNIHQFSSIIQIPYTTLVSALKNNLSGTGFQTVLGICKILKIKNTKNCIPILLEPQTLLDMERLLSLDEKGIENVLKMLEMEYDRCAEEYASES